MAVKRATASITVVDAAKIRIRNIFDNGLPVFLSFSAGKDSLVLAHLVLDMLSRGEISPEQLIVQFIDEEAIYPCIEEAAKVWRKKFMLLGARFDWYCIEVRHFNCFNLLENDESYICWDSLAEDVWVRRPPSFAIREHPLLRPRLDTYQDFLNRACRKGLNLIGIRTAESVQRLYNIANMAKAGRDMSKHNSLFPIYDWKDSDVWLYLRENNIEIPQVYLYLWQTGASKRNLRISQFFSVDTARSLVKMNEYYPGLMERIIRREPNAYLAALYWDSELFGRSSAKRRELEDGTAAKDYKTELLKMFSKPEMYFPTKAKQTVADKYRKLMLEISTFANEEHFKRIYEALIKGDPKLRTYRALYIDIYTKFNINTRKELEGLKE